MSWSASCWAAGVPPVDPPVTVYSRLPAAHHDRSPRGSWRHPFGDSLCLPACCPGRPRRGPRRCYAGPACPGSRGRVCGLACPGECLVDVPRVWRLPPWRVPFLSPSSLACMTLRVSPPLLHLGSGPAATSPLVRLCWCCPHRVHQDTHPRAWSPWTGCVPCVILAPWTPGGRRSTCPDIPPHPTSTPRASGQPCVSPASPPSRVGRYPSGQRPTLLLLNLASPSAGNWWPWGLRRV